VYRTIAMIGFAVLGLAGALLVHSSTAKNAKAGARDAAAIGRGKLIFQQKCSICHFDTSTARKIGPGLKGLNKRGTFTVNKNKVTDETLTHWIENGDSLMPPFKGVLDDKQIKDVVAYVRTL
jgi:mono/diheme cytochrome c family protein